ncbi:hypothetical protein CRUP_006664 [Coryphaenoides rupestris]|nr:hypothetical protein CRUP_006664 [Coryphaenoides rupestris]
MQSSQKPLFAAWLIEQVETGSYPGLTFISPNVFRVPWKHNSRKDCNEADCKIFRAWAVASGKIHEFPNDKAKWKTNFRCALKNLNRRFRMTKDNSKNSADPHKVYEIILRTTPAQEEWPVENYVPQNLPGARRCYSMDRWPPELQAQALCFPHQPTPWLDHKQIEYTNCILNSIQRGLLLEVRDSGLYGYRQDRCHVFASTADPSQASPAPQKLPQNTVMELLNFEKYIKELKEFKENKRGSPEYVVNMCFGEKFPDGKPLEKKLIVVKVVPLICRYFHELAQMEGASSLNSANISLQISDSLSLYDLIGSAFSLPTSNGGTHPAGRKSGQWRTTSRRTCRCPSLVCTLWSNWLHHHHRRYTAMVFMRARC